MNVITNLVCQIAIVVSVIYFLFVWGISITIIYDSIDGKDVTNDTWIIIVALNSTLCFVLGYLVGYFVA